MRVKEVLGFLTGKPIQENVSYLGEKEEIQIYFGREAETGQEKVVYFLLLALCDVSSISIPYLYGTIRDKLL
jgi:hypothetical protein